MNNVLLKLVCGADVWCNRLPPARNLVPQCKTIVGLCANTLGQDVLVGIVAEIRLDDAQKKESALLKEFNDLREKAIADYTAQAEADPETQCSQAISQATQLPGSFAPIFPNVEDRASGWHSLLVASIAQTYLAHRFHSSDEGLRTLHYKIAAQKPGKATDMKVSKVYTDQTSRNVKLYFIGKVVAAPCPLATGSKAVVLLGPVPQIAGIMAMHLYMVPTASMLSACGRDRTPAWMVRKTKEESNDPDSKDCELSE